VITQRICGVCPQSHGLTAALNLDSAFGIAGKIPDNARLLRNLIQGAHVVQDHILHFYHLAALDYVDIKDVAGYEGGDAALNSVKDFIMRGELGPFAPRYEGDYRLTPEANRALAHYIEALEIRLSVMKWSVSSAARSAQCRHRSRAHRDAYVDLIPPISGN
jgi:hydrogenase large subunit